GRVVYEWDLESGKSVGQPGRTATLLLPDGRSALSITHTGTRAEGVLLDLERGQELGRMVAVDSVLRDSCFFDGDRLLLWGNHEALQMLDLTRCRQLLRMTTAAKATERPRSLCGGRMPGELLWGANDGTVWATDPRGAPTLDGTALPLTQLIARLHTGDVT